MPIYEYQCTACGGELEVLQKISEAAPETCPACGKNALKKKISAAAFRLKGGGWYETDFKTGNKKNIAGGSEAAGGSKGESKPADKSGGESKSGSGGAAKDSGKQSA